jgi:MFS family permease
MLASASIATMMRRPITRGIQAGLREARGRGDSARTGPVPCRRMGSGATRPAGRSQPRRAERRLVLVVGAVVFLDTLFYAVIAPLLPSLSNELRLSKLSAGLLTASYPIGMLLGSIPGGVFAARAGPRLTVCLGLLLLACSTVAFGVLSSVAALDLARLAEGVGGACSWAGGLAWIVSVTPAAQRGTAIGRALAAAIAGSLFGPALGAVAAATGRPVLFGAVGAIAVVLIAQTRALPYRAPDSDQGLRTLVGVLRSPRVQTSMWLMALPAIVSGMINVLGPLRLHRLGGGAAIIGATFLIGAVIEAALAPLIGSLSDRRGRLMPLRAGLVGTTALLLCFTLPTSVALLGVLIVLVAVVLGGFWAPAMAMLSDAADARGLDQGLAAGLMNLGWAGGQVIGSAGGGAVARTAGDLVPTAIAAGLCALTLIALARPSLRARIALPTYDS